MSRYIDKETARRIIDSERSKEQMLTMLDNVPTADVRENVQGEWVRDGDCYICDQCKTSYGWWADSQCSNFCPNCGAYMRTKETGCDYERAIDQLEHDILYEPTFNQDDGSM